MSIAQTDDRVQRKPLRLWPGVLAVALHWLFWLVGPLLAPGARPFAMLSGLALGLVVAVWWLFFSRAPVTDRWLAALLAIIALAAAPLTLHESVATAMMGMMFFIYVVPVLSLVFVVWAAASSHFANATRRATMAAAIFIACFGWALFRANGISGDGVADFAWRWSETAEERLLAKTADAPPEFSAAPTAETVAVEAEWPGFRGPSRDDVVRGTRIAVDWSASPPAELWRRAVGPGWSSFAVQGDRFFTQEQRGEEEVVACYRLTTGEPIWRHTDPVRFWEANAGAGPRSTPALGDGRVYAFGATGLLNALDARDGAPLWSRDVSADSGVEVPGWGFSSSPLLVDDLVIIAAGGKLAAYDRDSGEPRWFGPDGGSGYSSPHLLARAGGQQVLLMSRAGAVSVSPNNGAVIWEHAWPGGSRIVQPVLIDSGDLLLSEGEGRGLRRVAVTPGAEGWTIEERWTTRGLKPYFSGFVLHRGHVYGFDGRLLACADLADGARKWKGGRYGQGQLLLLADQDLLLVLTEDGELALVSAAPDQFAELARVPAIEGKTWNHPVLVDDVLLVRNGREMAAFRLAGKVQ